MSGDRVPHVLLLGAFSFLAARAPGLPVKVTCVRSDPYDDELVARCVPTLVRADPRKESDIRAVARQVHSVDPLDAVVTWDDATMPIAAAIAEELGLEGSPSVATMSAATDKARMRETLRAAGLDTTPFRRCSSREELAEFLGEVGTPVVVKPAAGSAGRGVMAIAGADEVAEAWERVHAGGEPPGGVLAEMLLEGEELSVETVTVRGRHRVVAVTTKTTTGYPYFVETGHATDASPPETAGPVPDMVRGALDALGVTAGPCHTEVIVKDGAAHVVELNPRVAGGQIWEIVELATGVDLFASYLLSAAGLEAPPPYRAAGAAVRFFAAAEEGTLVEVRGVADALAMPGVVRTNVPALPRLVRPLRGAEDRLGFVVAVGGDREEAAARADAALARIDLVLRRPPAQVGGATTKI